MIDDAWHARCLGNRSDARIGRFTHILVTFVHVLPDGRRRGAFGRDAPPLGPQRPKRFLGDRTGGPRSAVERFRLRGRTGAAGARGQGVSSVRSATSDVGARPADTRTPGRREVWRDCGRDPPAWRPPAGRSAFVRSRTLRGGSSASCSGVRRPGRPSLPEIQTASITLSLGRCCAAPVGRLVRRPHVRCRAEARLKRQLLVCRS